MPARASPAHFTFAAVGALCFALASAFADAATVEVRMENYAFVPASVTIRVGDTVRWVNAEKRTSHSILFIGPGGFESDRLFTDDAYERRFDRPGRYAYTCGPHPEMRGVVVVE